MTRLVSLGRRPYRETLALMRDVHAAVAAGEQPDTWLVVEHEPVVTFGRNAKHSSLRVTRDFLAEHGIDAVDVERGGDATYHGPGQLVVYPVVRLERFREVVPFISALERATIAMLAQFDITAAGRSEHRGVYVGENAICAVGLAVKRMTSLHGLALNVSTALDYERLIAPCGTPQFGITSMSHELGSTVALASAEIALVAALAAEFDVRLESCDLAVPA